MQQIAAAKTRGMLRIEARRGIDLEAYLRQRYECEGWTQEQIADDLQIGVATVSRWMSRLGIETRLFASERARGH